MSAEANQVGKGPTRKGSSSGEASMMVLFSTTIFLSAALLFLVEPMFAKFVLPLFGSTPEVWTGSMMFFQAALLASYLYVHATASWLGARRQAVVHLAVVLLPLLVLPIAVPAGWVPPANSNPLFYLLGLLFVSVGLPFFAVAATNPLIQRWLSETDHPAARDPYFLYRASNLGSIIGLLGYPILMEPELRLASQGIFWSIGYGVLIVLVFASAVMLWRSRPAPVPAPEGARQEEEAPPVGGSLEEALAAGLSSGPTLLRRLRWIGLAFVPSSMMLGVTSFITTDITPIPLLWVIPLSLYLFSFVVVFSRSERMPDLIHKAMVAALPVMMLLLTLTIAVPDTRSLFSYWQLILLHLLGFFVAAMVMHGELARDRPPARYLTEFYLWVSVGGVLGGIFNALIAPIVFPGVVEYPLAIVLACLFIPGAVLRWLFRRDEDREEEPQRTTMPRFLDPRWLDLALPLALGVAVLALGWLIGIVVNPDLSSVVFQAVIGLATGLCLYFAYASNRPIRFGLGIGALMVAATILIGLGENVIYENRDFFGVRKITEDPALGTPANPYHALSHGDTNHGAEFLGQDPPEPITYYHHTGPIGQLFDALPNQDVKSRVALFGLGTGSMACYNQPGQRWTFYEIDPLVESIAQDPSLFTYLRDCPGDSEVVLGDARLKIAEAPDGEYGMIVGDAFSSDAIPVHLITREAMDLYLSKLRSDGVLAMHISNRHLQLEPVLGNLAQDRGLTCYAQYDAQTEGIPGKFASHWVVMARRDADLGSVPGDGRWQPCASTNATDVWTDDFSNLLSTFVWN